jgi:hypothetical protein
MLMKIRKIDERVAVATTFLATSIAARALVLSIETRFQLLGFAVLAAAYELRSRPALGIKPCLSGFAINAAVAMIGVILVRWQVEGLCPGLRQSRCIP